jgi:hypothetical protein
MKDNIPINAARLATMDQLLQTTIPAFLGPVPCRKTMRDWFEAAKIPRFKANPMAKRGGGTVYYQVAAVEKLLRSRLLPGRLNRMEVA